MIAITGANGQLGQLVIQGLLGAVPASSIVGLVRRPAEAQALHAMGVEVRLGDYDRPDTLLAALRGVDKLLLISAVQPGERLRQHQAVIDAAKQSGVTSIAYTSMLRADTSSLILAGEHLETEAYVKQSGLEYVILRNGWYLENHTGAVGAAIANGAVIGSAGQGRFASASRADYAAAAVKVLTSAGHANQTYELAGDHSFSMAEFAAELSAQTDKHIGYKDLPPQDYAAALASFGLPPMIIDVVIDADIKAQAGELDSTSRTLSELIGRKTTTLGEAIAAALRAS
ncbi:SDR family oxidoreductase [Oxalobacteraceae bacterium A2-2]